VSVVRGAAELVRGQCHAADRTAILIGELDLLSELGPMKYVHDSANPSGGKALLWKGLPEFDQVVQIEQSVSFVQWEELGVRTLPMPPCTGLRRR
jgi:hypothetical protein